jgi:hypothetical protein
MGLVMGSEVLSRQQSSQAVKLTAHFHLGPRLKLRGTKPPVRQIFFVAWLTEKNSDEFIFFLAHIVGLVRTLK